MKRTPELVAEAQILYNLGYGYSAIGRELGFSRHSIRTWFNGAENRAKVAKWREANPAKVKAHNRSYKETKARCVKEWRKANPERWAALNSDKEARRRARKRGTSNGESLADIYSECRRVSKETGIPHHVDHIIPLSKGGTHTRDNLQILTAEENLRKGAKLNYGA